jgi:hypothetical protein
LWQIKNLTPDTSNRTVILETESMIAETNIKSSADEALRHGEAVMVRPKRRFKINQPLAKAHAVDVPVPIPTTSPFPQQKRMKRSGRLHQQWHAAPEFCAAAPKLPAAPTSHELVGIFMQVCMRPAHSHHSTSVSAH